jgi:hypothetical protein
VPSVVGVELAFAKKKKWLGALFMIGVVHECHVSMTS